MLLVTLLMLVRIPSLAVSAFCSLASCSNSISTQQQQQQQQHDALRVVPAGRGKRSSSSIVRISSNDNDNKVVEQRLSAAAKERRDEERRRAGRMNDAVIGQTSAKKGAKDYAIDPILTQKELFSNANEMEREIYVQTELGKRCLHMLNVNEAWEAFERVYQLKPNAYMYQAGIALFYLDDFGAAGEMFAKNAGFFEVRFGLRATEERLWRDACELMLLTKDRKQQNKISKISPEIDDLTTNAPPPETRKIIRIARDLFDASITGDHSRMILSRAKLLWIANNSGSETSCTNRPDPKLYKLNSWYYLGLHYDVLGHIEESKACMKKALKLSSVNSNAKNDIIHTLPMLHLSRRDWFDDEPMDDDEGGNSSTSANDEQLRIIRDVEANIQDSVNKLLLPQIQDALGRRGLKTSGTNKADLNQRLFHALMEDANMHIFKTSDS